MKNKLTKIATPAMKELLRRSGSNDYEVSRAAQHQVAKALALPLKQGVLNGDILAGIYENIEIDAGSGSSAEFPFDWFAPGQESKYIAYTVPSEGKMPQRNIEGDYVMVPMYEVGAAIDWALKYARDARWDIVGRAMQVLEGMFVRKDNDDGFHTILTAGAGRNLVAYDDAATAGLFTKRLVNLLQIMMRRNAGGNSTSTDRGKLTDLFVSPEGVGDMRSWDLTQVDDVTRRQIFLADGDGGLTKIFGTTIHDLDELGENQVYDDYYVDTLGGTKPTDKVEIVVGLDLSKSDAFVHPFRGELEVYENMNLHQERRAGVYSWKEAGWALLDSRRVLLGAF